MAFYRRTQKLFHHFGDVTDIHACADPSDVKHGGTKLFLKVC